ncbi:MAG: pitrilysin family protein [Clostridia bacterium]
MNKIEVDSLKNGIRVVSERMDGFNSVALNVWLNTGSVYEREDEGGASHFIEHMLFKGTEKRSALEIAAEMDSIGGNMNAFTAKECTCYYARVLNENLHIAADMLADILYNSKFDSTEMEKEKGVICEEILMTEDTPDDVVHEAACSLYYQDDPLSKPILGTQESVRAFTHDSLTDYMKRNYTPKNIIISCAGSFNKENLLNELESAFSKTSERDIKNEPIIVTENNSRKFIAIEKDVEQVHMCIALPGFMVDHPMSMPFLVMNNALGGSMSSRLFQKIREQRGLAYSVYSYTSAYKNSGYFTLYAGTGEKQATTVYELLIEELLSLKDNGFTKQEFLRSKNQLRGSFILGLESTSARGSAIGKSLLFRGSVRTYEETIDLLNAVTMDDVKQCTEMVIDFSKMATALVGRTGSCKAAIENFAI